MKISNAKSLPERYYGLHFAEGVAHYPEHKATIYIGPKVAKEMDSTFSGKPVFVKHVDNYSLENIVSEADGWVVRSFYNKNDGKHWCEFLAVSDEAKDKIKNGWVLSNSYLIKQSGAGGLWHDVPYDQEVLQGEYDHMAIVPDPRYGESVVLTPEQFKNYNEEKEQELLKIANSKGDAEMLQLFKKKVEKLDNSKELLECSVVLPKSKVEKTIQQIINESDEAESKKDEKKYANETDLVKVGDGEMSIKELVEKFTASIAEEVTELIEEVEDVKEVENQDDSEGLKEEIVEKAKNSKDDFEELKKAHKKVANQSSEQVVYESASVQIQRGKDRY